MREIARVAVRVKAVKLGVVAVLGFAIAGLASGLSEPARIRTTSDLSEQEVISIANSARGQLETDRELVRARRPGLDREAAKTRAALRLAAMREQALVALQSGRAGLDEDLLEIAEKVPKRPRWERSENRTR